MVMTRHVIPVATTAAAIVALAGCGTTSAGSATSPASCHQQYESWVKGRSAVADKAFASAGQKLATAGLQQNLSAMAAALKQASQAAERLAAYPMPHCADPAGYWRQELTETRVAARDIGTSPSTQSLFTVGTQLDHIAAVQSKLAAELRKNIGDGPPS